VVSLDSGTTHSILDENNGDIMIGRHLQRKKPLRGVTAFLAE
jgi:hypothetical protein